MVTNTDVCSERQFKYITQLLRDLYWSRVLSVSSIQACYSHLPLSAWYSSAVTGTQAALKHWLATSTTFCVDDSARRSTDSSRHPRRPCRSCVEQLADRRHWLHRRHSPASSNDWRCGCLNAQYCNVWLRDTVIIRLQLLSALEVFL